MTRTPKQQAQADAAERKLRTFDLYQPRRETEPCTVMVLIAVAAIVALVISAWFAGIAMPDSISATRDALNALNK